MGWLQAVFSIVFGIVNVALGVLSVLTPWVQDSAMRDIYLTKVDKAKLADIRSDVCATMSKMECYKATATYRASIATIVLISLTMIGSVLYVTLCFIDGVPVTAKTSVLFFTVSFSYLGIMVFPVQVNVIGTWHTGFWLWLCAVLLDVWIAVEHTVELIHDV